MTLAMNKATIEESHKAIEQSKRLKKLTLLATFFIPLTFSTSLFGMNIDVLGQSTVRFWWYFVLCVPITLCAYILYLWDFQALRRFWMRSWKACRSVRRGMMGGRSQKEASHIV
jgi:Mg2+ and Co2+ transporter CorA